MDLSKQMFYTTVLHKKLPWRYGTLNLTKIMKVWSTDNFWKNASWQRTASALANPTRYC